MWTVAIVDTSDAIPRLMTAALSPWPEYSVWGYRGGGDFFDRYTPAPGCVLLSFCMNPGDGLGVLRGIVARGWAAPVIGMSTWITREALAEARSLGMAAFVEMPFRPGTMLAHIRKACAPCRCRAHG